MSLLSRKFVIGTRKSKLALWQTDYIKNLLSETWPGIHIEIENIVTLGDKTQAADKPLPEIGGKGLFTAELEEALLNKTIDMAVHSLKDLPTKMEEAFKIAATPVRASVWDVLISKDGKKLADLPMGACIGTSSIRRSSQILRMRSDLMTESIRGNVDTRISKLTNPNYSYDAILLAMAGVERLGRSAEVTQVFSSAEMLPAPGQGAIAVQIRSDDEELSHLLAKIHDHHTFCCVTAERSFLAYLNAGCNTPVAAYAEVKGDSLHFLGRCLSKNGKEFVEVSGQDHLHNAEELGMEMARRALGEGADRFLDKAC